MIRDVLTTIRDFIALSLFTGGAIALAYAFGG